MLASGFLSPIDTARAKLQEQIGFFLSSRAKLIRLMSHVQLSIQGQARGLYATQTTLENRLQNEITPKLQSISAGVWDSSDILLLGGFTMQIMNQIQAVNSLERQAGGAPTGMFSDMNLMTVLLGAGVLLSMGIMGGVFFVGRRSTI